MVDWLTVVPEAGAVVNDEATAVVAGEIIVLDPTDIDIGDRLRPIDPVWAEAIGQAMQRDGQIYPVDVCRQAGSARWLLAGPGGHRVTGAQIVGMDGIEARVVSSNPASRRRREAAENLFRRANDPVERAAAIAELVKLHKLRAGIDPSVDGRVASAAARWQTVVKDEARDATVTMTGAYGFSEIVANELGLSTSTVERDLMLYRRLAPSLLAKLREARHPVATNGTQLRTLAKLDPVDQERVVGDLLRGGVLVPKTVAEALHRMRGTNRPIDPAAKRHSTVIGTWGRMGIGEKKGVLSELRSLLPAGYRLVEEGRETRPDDKYRLEMIAAMDAAITLFDALSEGGEPVDDATIHDARTKLHLARLAASAGAVPAPKGVAA